MPSISNTHGTNSHEDIIEIFIDRDNISRFRIRRYDFQQRGGMFISEQINAVNFRLRESHADYKSDWHVAGDPTLIILLEGRLKITLQDGTSETFKAGDKFIAGDYMREGIEFSETLHGHQAEVIGTNTLKAVHIKLEKRS